LNPQSSPAQVILWVLGEYGTLADVGAGGVLRALGSLAEEHTLADPVRGYLLTAMAKLATQVRASVPEAPVVTEVVKFRFCCVHFRFGGAVIDATSSRSFNEG